MKRGEFADAGERTPEELRRGYEALLVDAIDEVGIDAVAADTAVDRETVEALAAGESPEIELEDAAAVLALAEEHPGADAVTAEARDILMLGMTTAVLDVEALASGVNGALEPKEIQQKVEGRFPITLGEYATLHQYIEQRKG